jgi:tryptophan-rich sensory protein
VTYTRFAAMIATSTVVMFVLMYLNTYAWEHVFYSETRAYMAILMGATMAVIMMGYMFAMYPSRAVNIGIFAVSFWSSRLLSGSCAARLPSAGRATCAP